MTFALLSDTHGALPDPREIRGVDAVLFAGDIAPDVGQQRWLDTTFAAWCRQVRVPIHATWGNHDNPATCNLTLKADNLHVHIDELVTVHTHRIWFSPWVPPCGWWSWQKDESALTLRYANIPEETTMIVSHGPPRGACDRATRDVRDEDGVSVGSLALAARISQLPLLEHVICGHIHEGYGCAQLGSVTVLNVAQVDEHYRPGRQVVTLTVP